MTPTACSEFPVRLPRRYIPAALAAAIGAVRSVADEISPSPRVLMIGGGCCHDYPRQQDIIRDAIDDPIGGGSSLRCDWTVLRYGTRKDIRAEVYESRDWIDGFDLVIHNECFGDVTDPAFVRGIVDAHHRTSTPAMFIHCSMHSYRYSAAADEWRGLVGVRSVRHESVKRPLDVRWTDAAGGHAPAVAARDAAGGGEVWTTPNGELYLIDEVLEGVEVVAAAGSVERGDPQPVMWWHRRNGCRVAATTLGHHNETMRSEPYQAWLAAAATWCVGR